MKLNFCGRFFCQVLFVFMLVNSGTVLAGFQIKADLVGTQFQGNGRQAVSVKLASHGSMNVYADELKWKVTESNDSLKLAPCTQFSSFCIDLTRLARNATEYQVQDVSAKKLGEGVAGLGGRQLLALGSLFKKFYDSVTTGATAAAFQLAVWEIVYDTPGKYAVGKGKFRSTNQSSIRDQANEWLNELTNDGVSLRLYNTDNGQSQVGLSPAFAGGFAAVPEPFLIAVWSVLGCVVCGVGLHRRRSMKVFAA